MKAQRELSKFIEKNNNIIPFRDGVMPVEYEMKMFEKGSTGFTNLSFNKPLLISGHVWLYNNYVTSASFPVTRSRHNGTQPYRIGDKNLFPDTFSSFAVPKGYARFKAKIDHGMNLNTFLLIVFDAMRIRA